MSHRLLYFILCCLVLTGCEKEVTIDLPSTDPFIVVEGKIEQDGFPLVILTRSIPYYTELNSETLAQMFVKGAKVKIRVDSSTIELDQICLSQIGDSTLIKQVGEMLNLPPGFDDFCIFSSSNPALKGVSNKTYHLIVEADGKTLNSSTTIRPAIALDSLWFKQDGDKDSLGFIYANLTDPVGKGDAYRWFAKRINHFTFGEQNGKIKDNDFVAPFNSAFDDEFFDGKSFPFAYNRGRSAGARQEDDLNQERGYFKRGDTVVVKFTTIDEGVYQYYRSFYNSAANSGSPFASPANIKSNVSGGLGVWAGYGVSFDTLVISK